MVGGSGTLYLRPDFVLPAGGSGTVSRTLPVSGVDCRFLSPRVPVPRMVPVDVSPVVSTPVSVPADWGLESRICGGEFPEPCVESFFRRTVERPRFGGEPLVHTGFRSIVSTGVYSDSPETSYVGTTHTVSQRFLGREERRR